jgi:ferritin-like metal-binding protein YciE
MYYAERAILKSLPDLVAAAQSENLKQALRHHAEETKAQVGRLDEVFKALGRVAEGVTCEAMVGLLQESDEVLKESGNAGPIRDAAIIACAQAVEHYEIARYGTLAQWARDGGRAEVATLLERSLEEEKQADAKLNQIAKDGVNQAARA